MPLISTPHSFHSGKCGVFQQVRMWYRGRTTPRRGGDINTIFICDIMASKDLNEETVVFFIPSVPVSY